MPRPASPVQSADICLFIVILLMMTPGRAKQRVMLCFKDQSLVFIGTGKSISVDHFSITNSVVLREDCKCFTRDCIGAIYRGYSSWTEAVEAYMDAVNKGTTKVLPLVVIQEEASADNGL
jgi:hypothetical protein